MARRYVVAGIVSSVACFTAIDAPAQEVAPQTGAQAQQGTVVRPDAPTQLDTIIVTSQKRKEDVKEVPLSITVLSGAQLQDNRIVDFADITRNVANVSYSSQAGAGLSTLEIRGVSSQAGSATVGIYLDEVSLTTRNLYSQGTAEPRFFDIDRVEVLRGPQGTLYGAGSLGGTIRFISNQPDLHKLTATVDTEMSDTKGGGINHQVQAVLNIPLVENRLALRIGVQEGRDSGYIDQVSYVNLSTIDKNINANQWEVVKLSAKAMINDNWSVTPALFVQHYKTNDIDASFENVGSYQPANTGLPLPPFQTSKTVREPGDDRLTVPSVTVNGDLGWADLTTVASTYTRRFTRTQDGTYINSSYIGTQVTDPALGAIVGNLPSAVLLDNGIDQTSGEVRLNSKPWAPGRFPVTWLGGLFASQTKTNVKDNEPVFGINNAFTSAGQDITNPNDLAGAFPNDFPGDSSYYSARHYDDIQKAVFGEATYNFGPTLRLTTGMRYLYAEQAFHREGDYYFAGGPSTASIYSTTHATTPRVALDWDITPTLTAYSNIAKGFRLGAANRPIPNTSAVQSDLSTLGLAGFPPVFQPDSLWSYEVGTKSRFLDNRLSLNASLFYINWKNIQQDVTLPTSGFDFETNVGKATSEGGELEARALLIPHLTLSAAAGYTHAVFAENVPALGTDGSGNYNVRDGDPIEGVPRYNARLGTEYNFEALQYDGIFRLNGQWTGSSHGTFIRGQQDYMRPGYFTLDGSVSFLMGKYELKLFVQNATNSNAILQQPSIQSVNEAYQLRPRTIGIGLSGEL